MGSGQQPAPLPWPPLPLTATKSWSFYLDLEAMITSAQSVAKAKAAGPGFPSVHAVTRAYGRRLASFRLHPRASLPRRGQDQISVWVCVHTPGAGGCGLEEQAPLAVSWDTTSPWGWGGQATRVTVPCRPHSNTQSPLRLNSPLSGLCPPHRGQGATSARRLQRRSLSPGRG